MNFSTSILFTAIYYLISNSVWAENKMTSSPVTFLQNKGQWQQEILYKGTSSTPVSFLKDGISFAHSGKEIKNYDGSENHPFVVWNMKFVKSNKDVHVSGLNGNKSVYSYLSGNEPSKWIIHPDEFTMLKYQSVFENIDLFFYGTGNSLKYDFIVHKDGNIN